MGRGRRLVSVLGVVAMMAAAVTPALGQTFPDRPIRIIVPFPPGNASDLAARAVAEPLAKRLGQPVVVENKPGAAGTIGAEFVARAKPDGYTVLVTSSAFSVTPSVYKKLPYDAERELVPVSPIGWTVMVLVAHPSFPANNTQEFITTLKAEPGKYSYAHLGSGALSQMVMELLKQMGGVDVVGVPYKGSGQALADLIGGQLPLMFDGLTSASPQIKAGRVKPIAISAKTRTRFAPDIPTLAESGVPALKDYDVLAWTGMFAPAGTPKGIVDRLNAEIGQIVQGAEGRERLATQNLEAFPPMTPPEFGTFMASEFERWRKVAREGKIEAQQ
jgi:tripartite-type tricarboxylate transporter receptor subunit TctC